MGLYQKAIEFFQTPGGKSLSWHQMFGFDNDNPQRSAKEFIENGYIKASDVKPVVDKIAQNVGSVGWKVYTKDRNGELTLNTDSKLNDLLDSPNPKQTWGRLNTAAIINLLVTGNSFLKGVDSVGFAPGAYREIEILLSQGVAPIVAKDYSILGYEYEIARLRTKYTLEEIIHLSFFNPSENGLETGLGISPLQAGMDAYQTSINQWKASSSLLKNKGAVGFISNDSDDVLEDDEYKSAQASFNRKAGGASNFGKVIVTPSKMKYNPMGMTAGDMKVIEIGIMTLRAICNIFGVDSSLFNDPANKTYNNRKEAEKAMWTNTVIPLLNMLSEEYNRTFVKAYSEEEGKDLVLSYDVSGVEVLQEDKDKKIDRVIKMINAGLITDEQGKERLDIND